EPRKISGSATEFAAKLGALVDVSPATLATKISAAKPTDFVEAITLRESDFTRIADKLLALDGVVIREQELPLAPTREFARAFLGTVGPVTADIVEESRGRYRSGDQVGLSGIQRQFNDQLTGTAGLAIMSGDKEIFATPPKPGKPLTVTLEAKIQQSADAALIGTTSPSAIVAVRISSGALVAVANSPATGLNRALVGRYAPGSTFKMVSTLALMQKGLSADQTVNCPKEIAVSGRKFGNYQGEEFGSVPFSRDFALSCNTAFIGLSEQLSSSDLQNTAASLGVGQKWPLGVEAFTGSVPQTVSDVDLAAATIGQGRSELSPAALAVATAAMARGSYLPPTLVNPPKAAGQPKPLPAAAAEVGKLMRLVVTDGTGAALKSVAGGPVSGKTGTAEFGTDSPPKTRAWMIGWQGDLAFAVLVEEGKSGGTVAGPVAAKFLNNATG
ncbi:MAG: penicillin-binding transpeptidase domain-containing protein, partial [Angustibacter sp.]